MLGKVSTLFNFGKVENLNRWTKNCKIDILTYKVWSKLQTKKENQEMSVVTENLETKTSGKFGWLECVWENVLRLFQRASAKWEFASSENPGSSKHMI